MLFSLLSPGWHHRHRQAPYASCCTPLEDAGCALPWVLAGMIGSEEGLVSEEGLRAAQKQESVEGPWS